MQHNRKLILLSLIVALAFTLSPLGFLAANAQQPVELRVAWWGSQVRHDRTIKVIEMFMQKYPNIKITHEFAGWDDYWVKMTTQASGSNLPDVMQQDYAKIGEWQTRKLIIPFDDYVKDGTLNFKNVADSALKGGVIDGKLYAINLGMNSQTFVLDTDCFKKAGLDMPSQDWTWDDLEKIALTLYGKLNIPGMSRGLSDEQIWKSLYLALGEWSYTPDGTQIGYKDDKPFVDHLKMIQRLEKAKATITREQENANKNYTPETDPIVKKQACITYLWSNQIIAMWNASGNDRNFVLYPLPKPTSAKQSSNYLKPSQFWSITSSSKHPKEAAMFVDFFTNSVEGNQILLAERGVPISSVVRDALKPQLGKPQTVMFDFVAAIEAKASPIPQADPPGHSEIINNIYYPQVIDAVLYGTMKPEDGAAFLREEANLILAKNKKK